MRINLIFLLILSNVFCNIFLGNSEKIQDTRILALRGLCYEDLNENALYDEGEPGFAGVRISLPTSDVDYKGNTYPNRTSGPNGYFLYDGMTQRQTYDFFFINPAGYIFETYDKKLQCLPGKACIISTTPTDGLVASVLIQDTYAYNIPLIKRKDFPAGSSLLTVRISVDFGYYEVKPLPSALLGSIFIDDNGNGVQDTTDSLIPSGIEYGLYNYGNKSRVMDMSNSLVPFSLTDANGRYKFDGLPDGQYCIKAENTLKYGDQCIGKFEVVNKNLTKSQPSDGVTAPNVLYAPPVGTIPLGTALSGQLFLDQNRNGVKDPNETYTVGTQATLYISSTNTVRATDIDGKPVPPFTTDTTGRYKFDSLPDGTYCIRVDGADYSQDCIGKLSTADKSKLIPSTPSDGVLSPVILNAPPLGVPPLFTGSAVVGPLFNDANGNGVMDGSEKPTPGILVGLYQKGNTSVRASDSFGKIVPTSTTDANGNYKFENVPDGEYCVRVESASYDKECTFITVNKGNASPSNPSDSVKSPTINRTPPIVLAPLLTGSAVSGPLFNDTNGNGILDGGEKVTPGIQVGLFNKGGSTRAVDSFGKPVPSSVTDANGKYKFENLPDGEYCIRVDNASFESTCTPIIVNKNNASPTVPSDGVKSPTILRTPPIILSPSFTGSGISGPLFNDANGNGVLDGNEQPTPGVQVGLFNKGGSTRAVDSFGKPVPSSVTDANGKYKFENVPDGEYCVKVETSSYEGICTPIIVNKNNTLPSTPSDGVKSPTILRTPPIVLSPSFTGTAIAGSFFNDTNGNGVLDSGEKPTPGVSVSIYNKGNNTRAVDSFGKLIPSTTTDANGKFNFENLPDGEYCVRVDNASFDGSCISVTVSKGNTSPSTPSDGVKSPTILRTPPFVLSLPFTGSAIAGSLFNDTNGNGVLDSGEQPTSGVSVSIYNKCNVTKDSEIFGDNTRAVDSFGKAIPSSITDSNGRYVFENLPNGDYCTKVGSSNDCVSITVDKNKLPPSTPSDGVRSATILRNPPMPSPVKVSGAIVGPLFVDTNGNGVLDGSESAVSNVQAGLYNLNDGSRVVDVNGQQIPLSTTDTNGKYKFDNVPSGEYCIKVAGATYDADKCFGRLTVDKDGLSPSVPSDGVKSPSILRADPLSVPLASSGSAVVGPLFVDSNGNGILDGNEKVTPGIVAGLYYNYDFLSNKTRATDEDGNQVPLSTTDANGKFKFDNLQDGTYCIKVSDDNYYTDKCYSKLVVDHTKLPPSTPSDGVKSPVLLTTAPIAILPAAIGGAIAGPLFNDVNGNGVLDGTEKLTPGIVAGIYYVGNQSRVIDNYGNVVPLSTTDANGRYKFDNLPDGQYCILIEGGGANQDCIGRLAVDKTNLPPSTPSDGIKSPTILRTPPMAVPPMATGSAIVGPLFKDSNGNGYLDGSETVSPGVQAGLYNINNKTSRVLDSYGNVIPISTTDANGRFKFENVPDGDYCIRVTGETYDADKCVGRLTIDKKNLSPSVTSDGVKSPTILKTAPIAVPLATTGSAIAGPLFVDTNGNGILDGSESAAPQGIQATLYFQGNKTGAVDKDGKVVPPSTTDATGRYKFDNIPDGQYCIRVTGEYFNQDKCFGNFVVDKTNLPPSTPSDGVKSPVISRNPSIAIPPAAIGGAITGPLFKDDNGNGVLDGNEKLTPDIVAGLYYVGNQSRVVDNFGKLVPLSTTDANGKYKFDNLPDGQYCILVEGAGANQDCIGKLSVDKNTLPKSTPSDGIKSPTILRAPPMAVPPPAIGSAIVGTLFKDENGNGILDGNEKASQDLSLGIYFFGNKSRAVDSNGQFVSLSITGPDGKYKFDNMPDGEYCIKAGGTGQGNVGVTPDCIGQIVVVKNKLPDPDPSEHVKSSVILRVPPLSTVKPNIASAMSGQVYIDSNGNDVVDNGELKSNVRAGLYISGTNTRAVDKDGIVIPYSVTDVNGRYKFDNIPDGEYCVRVTGQDLNLDCVGKFFIDKNDLPPSTPSDGVKAPTILRNAPLDIKAPPTGSAMTGLLYTDTNGNGNLDSGEPTNANVRVGLYHLGNKSRAEDINGNLAPLIFTDAKGGYKFDNIPDGDYCISVDSTASSFNQDCIGKFSIDKHTLPESYQSDGVEAPTILRNPPLNTAPPTTGSSITGALYVDANKSGYLDRGELKQGVRVSLYISGTYTKATDKDGKQVPPSITDSNGKYTFDNIPNGDYCIRVEGTDFNQDCIGKFSVDKTKLPPSYPSDGVSSSVILRNDPIDIAPPITGSALAGPIYPDRNGNGYIDQDEKPIPNVRTGLYYYGNKTRALDKDGQVVALSITGPDGKYKFENLADGIYCVKVEGAQFDKDCVGRFEINKDNLSPSYPSDDVKSPVILRAQPLNVLPPKVTSALTGLLFKDENGNGIMDLPAESSGENIPATIYYAANKTRALDNNGQLVPISYTGTDGKYKFDNLLDGQYCIRVEGLRFDKDCIGKFDINHLAAKLPESVPSDNVNAPYILRAAPLNILPQADGSAIAGAVYNDAVGDGAIDSYAQNVRVGLYFLGNKSRAVDTFGQQVSLSITGSDGKYKFDNIPNGQYCLRIESDKFFDAGCVDQIDVNNRVLQKPVASENVRAPTILRNEPIGLVPLGDRGLKGLVFNDRDMDTIRSINEAGISNIQVKLYLQSGVELFSTAATNLQGQWSISGLTQDYLVRIEFNIPDEYVSTGGKTVYFAKAGQTTDINLGLVLKSSLGSGIGGIDNPTGFTTTCFAKGLYNGKNAGEAAVVDIDRDAQGKSSESGNVGFTKVLARHKDVGSVHGITFNPITTDRYVASYHKVGSDFGPAGSCAIYKVTSGGVPSIYANLNEIFGKAYCGEYSHNFAVNEVGVAGPNVGKVSLGQLTYFNSKLYVTNLAKNEILIIPTDTVPTIANIQRITVGNPGCYNQDRSPNPGDWHVFSVTVHKGEIYAGGVCSGETGSRVSAYIVKYNGDSKSFSTALFFNLNHARGCRSLDINANCVSALNEKWSQKDTSQAILSSILFDGAGKLYMAFKDRSGDIASLNQSPELLVACLGADGKYYLENGGKCGNAIGSGVGQKSLDDSIYGPGYGNFFDLRKENYHDYTGAFGIAKAGRGQIITTGYDAFDEFEGSVRWYNTSNGSTRKAFSVYSNPSSAYAPFNSQRTTLNATKNGLGDITTIYDKLANQYRIGRIWSDTNGNGLADAYEKGISGIRVYLINGDEIDPVADTTTDANGYFKFEVDYSKEYYVAARISDFLAGSDVTIANADSSRPQTNSDASIVDNAFVAYFKSKSTGGHYFNGVNFGIIKK